ncbi:MAG TPA: phospholipase A [Burkholderiales bacterium]|nr:phospholipase A [Burkholderiales bacterium]
MNKNLLFLLLLLLHPLSAQSEWILTQVSPRAVGGEPLEVDLVIINDTRVPIAGEVPQRLPIRLVTKDGPLDAELKAAQMLSTQSKPLAPGEFRKHRYRIVLPEEIVGPIALEISDAPSGRLVVLAERPQSVATTPQGPSTEPVTASLRPTDTTPPAALQTFEPMYFVVGRREDETTARFQLSFKYRLFDEKSWLGILAPPAAKLYFGYTQVSLWDMTEASAPFRDTAYKPSLFYLDPQIWSSPDGGESVEMQAGLEHESNGRGDEDSRSVNVAYVKPTWRKFLNKDWFVSVSPKVWAYLDKDDNNDDIEDYRGYANLNLTLGRVDGWQFSADMRKGTKHFGSVQLDASYPLRQPFFANAGGYVHFQYFNGYGESLLDYDQKGPSQFRIGFSIVR